MIDNTIDTMFNIETYLDSLPKDIEEIYVVDEGITVLDVSKFKNLKKLNCSFNQLTSLLLNENLQELSCSYNLLTSLHLNEKLKYLTCNNNQLTSLLLNENLEYLACNNNQLTSLHLNKNLEYSNCQNNQLISLFLNEKSQIIRYNNNPIHRIIDGKFAIKKLKILNNFRYLYYCLKYKKQFRDLLWIKIREPKIRKKYSHDYLVENLYEDTDLDELLDNW